MHLAMQQAAAEIEQMGADSEDEEEEEEEEGPDVDEGGEGKAAALRTLRKMQCWWQPRQVLLAAGPDPVDFEFEASSWKENKSCFESPG